MDITSVASIDVAHFYSRQDKYALARKKAQARLIKTAVAERVTLSEDARQLAKSILPDATRHARQVSQPLASERRSYSAAREYRRNQVPDESTGPTPAVDKTTPVARGQGEIRALEHASQAGTPTQMDLTLASPQAPQYAFPLPRELKIYLSNIPSKKPSQARDPEHRKAA